MHPNIQCTHTIHRDVHPDIPTCVHCAWTVVPSQQLCLPSRQRPRRVVTRAPSSSSSLLSVCVCVCVCVCSLSLWQAFWQYLDSLLKSGTLDDATTAVVTSACGNLMIAAKRQPLVDLWRLNNNWAPESLLLHLKATLDAFEA